MKRARPATPSVPPIARKTVVRSRIAPNRSGDYAGAMNTLYLLLALLGGLLILAVLIYNKLVSKRALVENGWSDIEVQLKRRADLIPRLVETVKGYASHERQLFLDVISARNAALAAGANPAARGTAETALSAPTARLLALKEAYPDLKSNENFLALQTELSETEDKIEMARRFYNGATRELNVAVSTVPNNLIAGPLGFHEVEYFEIETADRTVPTVDLDV